MLQHTFKVTIDRYNYFHGEFKSRNLKHFIKIEYVPNDSRKTTKFF